jgi:transcriptional regulator with XRE-family HTH domain
MKVGNRIKSLRIEKDFSTDFMAEQLGISDQTYRKYESDKNSPDLNVLEKIACTLGKNFIDLLPENILFNNNDQKGGLAVAQNLGTINNLSEKLIEQYEERIKDLKQTILDLKK